MAMSAIPSICAEYYSNLRYSYCSLLPSATDKYEKDCANFHTKSSKLLFYGFTFSYLLSFVNTDRHNLLWNPWPGFNYLTALHSSINIVVAYTVQTAFTTKWHISHSLLLRIASLAALYNLSTCLENVNAIAREGAIHQNQNHQNQWRDLLQY